MQLLRSPYRMHSLAVFCLLLGAACAILIVADELRHPQKMAIMNIVWPVSALFGTVLVLWVYRAHGRACNARAAKTPMGISVGISALHCGAGCMLGDLIAEWLAFAAPAVLVVFGWQWVFADRMFAVWGLDLLFAFALGIVFQYFAIKPMRNLSAGAGLAAAVKADTLSLIAWQVGMYACMALIQLRLFPHLIGHRAEVDSAEFWFAMQVAMLSGLVTAYPVNWWLVRAGIKEAM